MLLPEPSASKFSTDALTWERPVVCVVPRDGAPFAVLNELLTNHWRYTAEPGLYVFGLGVVRHDDTVVVGDMPEVLTRAPKDLRSQTIA